MDAQPLLPAKNMSEFLGRKDCIESLQKDLVDLQGAILDVFSRTGPIRFPSWKFPDKLSCNLDMVALLERYDFMDGDGDFNQHSNTVLLELVIDRLVLLLQSLNTYIEQNTGSHRKDPNQQKGCLSVGLVVRNYWSNLVNCVSPTVNVKNSVKLTKARTIDHNEAEAVPHASPHMNSSYDSRRPSLSAWSSTSSFKFLPQYHGPSIPSRNTPFSPEAGHRNIGCQTMESSLIPCDACYQVQSLLRKTGDALVEVFKCEGLPSSLHPFLTAVEDTVDLGHMTAGDVSQLAKEQLRDMRRLEKHLQDVRDTVKPLKDKLSAVESEREKFRSQLEKVRKEFKQQTEKHQATIVQLEFSLKKAQRSMKETERKLQDEQNQLKKETLSLEDSNSELNEKVAEQQDTLQALECEKSALLEKVKSLQLEEEACCKLQQRIQQMESQICELQVLLDKETAKYHSVCRHQESMQAKQKSLLDRVDALDEECEELHMQLGEGEERHTNLDNELQQMSVGKAQLQAQLSQQQDSITELQKEKQMLDKNVGYLKKDVAELKEYAQALKERERLLVAFPELSPLAQTQPQSTGNVLLDMEQQMQANSIRVKVLEQENATLHCSLEKLRERERNAAMEASLQQMWTLSPGSTPGENQQNGLTTLRHSPETRLDSPGSKKNMSTTADSPSSLPIHRQNLHLNIPRFFGPKANAKTTGSNQRRK